MDQHTFVSKWRFSLGYDAINQLQLADLKRLAALNFYGPPNFDFAYQQYAPPLRFPFWGCPD